MSKPATPSASASPRKDRLIDRYAEANLPTEYGDFRVVVYRDMTRPVPSGYAARPGASRHPVTEHIAIIKGDIKGQHEVLLRVHSECLTGEVLHSLKCDCREQLDLALKTIAEAPRGVVVYLRQEGRGIGLGNKIRAYALQEAGADTVDANRALGFPDDLRRYDTAAAIIADLGIESVRLMTNNPLKLRALAAEGVDVRERVPSRVPLNRYSRPYVETKRDRMGHMIDGPANTTDADGINTTDDSVQDGLVRRK